ncbi:MAG TPA: hypothetical protein VLS90_02005, partial [Thermodesulfobacteriota bacterium]|nr:hypothetical protein [Thermodesulfobacteriota bacterium]
RVLRDFPLVQHEFRQKPDLSCELTVRPVGGPESVSRPGLIRALQALFGRDLQIRIRVNPRLGQRRRGGKTLPYTSNLLLEE